MRYLALQDVRWDLGSHLYRRFSTLEHILVLMHAQAFLGAFIASQVLALDRFGPTLSVTLR